MPLTIYQALSVCDDHISLYQLTLERGTPLYKNVISGKQVRLLAFNTKLMYFIKFVWLESYCELLKLLATVCFFLVSSWFWFGCWNVSVGSGGKEKKLQLVNLMFCFFEVNTCLILNFKYVFFCSLLLSSLPSSLSDLDCKWVPQIWGCQLCKISKLNDC